MLDDFKRALARVQSDYGFYIECQANPAVALGRYDLSTDERSTFLDPAKLAEALSRGIGVHKLPPVTIKICGTHDWVNRAATDPTPQDTDRSAMVEQEVRAVKRARTPADRTGAAVRLMELIG